MATALLAKGDHAAALTYADRALALGALVPRVHVARANALIGLHRLPEAADELEMYLKAAPDGDLAVVAERTVVQIRPQVLSKGQSTSLNTPEQ
jgi:regulator of sirC expression with transglutaminase-like and TPR domain